MWPHRYRVDINKLFDCDEPFLFENAHFRALVKKVCVQYPHLVNDNYDVSAITSEKMPEYNEYRERASLKPSNDGLIDMYRKTFRMKSSF